MDSPDIRNQAPRKKAPSPRRDGREAAVQYLYVLDLQAEGSLDPAKLAEFWDLRQAKEFVQKFAGELLTGIDQHLGEIDSAIRDALQNFSFHRLTTVDRSILRVATYEVLFSDQIPAPAAINEAIEIAKRFGTEESPAFVNGVLDRILQNRAVG
jgi:transcription antitermination protein NusB